MVIDDWFTGLIAVVVSIIASSGFWAWFQHKDTRQTATVRLLMGLAHDRIVYLGMKYIQQGWVTKDEFEDLNHYLYEPYSKFGGNGLAKRVMEDVSKLPIRGNSTYWPTEVEKSS